MKNIKHNLVAVALLSALGTTAAAEGSGNLDAGIEFKNRANTTLSQSQFNNAKFSDRLIIKYKNENQFTSLKQAKQANLGMRLGVEMQVLKRNALGARIYKLNRMHSESELKDLISNIKQSESNIEYVEIDQLLQPMATPNDTYYNNQWHYYESTGGLNLPTAWDVTQGSGVVVAVLDTGYRPHVDLNDNLLPGYDMISDAAMARDGNGRDADARDEGDWVTANQCGNNPAQDSSWHGTHVAGTIAAETNNNQGVAGVAYKSKVVPVRVLGRCGGYTSDIADGIIWAAGGSVSGTSTNANPAKVINMSLGGGGSCPSTTQNAINVARSSGAVVVVAAGNSNQNAGNFTPASCNGVITVAATNRSGGRAYYSNYGNAVDVAAPGGDIRSSGSNGVLSTLNSGATTPGNDNYEYFQGTSMAAPHVAGVAALMYAAKPSITPDEVESVLKSSSRSFPATCSGCGTGIVDATAAVNAVTGGGGGGGGGGSASELQNGVAKTGLGASSGQEIRFTMEVPAGATNLNFAMAGGSGDADLYVRYGSQPTTSAYDCRPYKNGNSESCAISNVQAGTYHVMIRAYSTFSGVSLTGSYTEGGGGGGGATGGSASESNISGSRRAWKHYTVEIPAGMSTLTVQMSGGSGDADLYVRRGSQPTSSSYDCRPYKNGNNETCTFNNPNSGTWHISLYGYSTYSGVNLNVEWKP